MKFSITLFIVLFNGLTFFSNAQSTLEWGGKFEFDLTNEKDLKFVLVDNYNHYMLSNINVDGMLAEHKIIIRKFDQKNQVVDVYKYDFPKVDAGALSNFLGSAENTNGQLAIYTESYSGKVKKKEIYQILFDKSTSAFTSSVVATYPIESNMKSGYVKVHTSLNGQFVGINYQKHAGRKDPKTDYLNVIETQTFSKVWNKDVTFQDNFRTHSFGISNSGKIALIRTDDASKSQDYLVWIDAGKTEEKTFQSQVQVHTPKIISIGNKEYLIAFNKALKGFMKDPYENLMLYDLESGTVLANDKIIGIYSHKDLVDVEIRNIFVENGEINVFTEGKLKAGTRDAKSPMGTVTIQEAYYIFTSSYMIQMSFEGAVANVKKLVIEKNNEAPLYKSFGVLKAGEDYYTNTGLYNGIHKLNPKEEKDKYLISFNVSSDPYYGKEAIQYVNQLFLHFPDSKKFIVAKTVGNNGMALVNVFYDRLP